MHFIVELFIQLSHLITLKPITSRMSRRTRVKVMRWFPTFRSIQTGMFLTILAMLFKTGGIVTLQLGEDQQPTAIQFPMIESQLVFWVLLVFGLDSIFTNGRLLPFIQKRVLLPVIAKALEPLITAVASSEIGRYIKTRIQERWAKNTENPQ